MTSSQTITEKNTSRKINREIFALAIPNVISNVTVPLMGSVDTWLMGQLSVTALAAVGVGSMIFNFMYWNMGFLRMGTTGLTAQAFGRADEEALAKTLMRALILGLAIAVLLIAIKGSVFDVARAVMSISPEEGPAVWTYFSILIYAAPAILCLKVFLGWFFGMQNARIPLLVSLVINLMNIVMSIYFVRVLKWGISGAAWGTLVAQYLGVLMCVLFVFINYRKRINIHHLAWRHIKSGYAKLLTINADIFIRTVFLSTAFVLIFRFSKELGSDFLAINIIFLQFLHWMSYAIDGFAYASESLVGKYKGADHNEGLSLSIKWNLRWAFGLAILFSLTYGLFSKSIFRLFINEEDNYLLDLAGPYLPWMAAMPLVAFASYIWDGIYVGLTASRSMRNSMISAFLIYISLWFLLPESLSNHRIWLAFFFFLISRGVFMYWLYRQKGWQGLN